MSYLTKMEGRYEELLEELLEEHQLEKINKRIETHEVIERINIKEIESEILDETEPLEELKKINKKSRDNNI